MGRLDDIGKFSESGRGAPVTLSRPGGALPFSPIVRHQYAPNPRTHLGWAQGLVTVGDVRLEPCACALTRDATVAAVAAKMLADETGFVPICHDGRLAGVIFEEDLLRAVAGGQIPPSIGTLISSQFPTCSSQSALVDAVRLMLSCYLRKLPVVGDAGELVGLLTLAEAMAASEMDPTVADLLERFALSPSLYARRMR